MPPKKRVARKRKRVEEEQAPPVRIPQEDIDDMEDCFQMAAERLMDETAKSKSHRRVRERRSEPG